MSEYAELNKDGNVLRVIVIEAEMLATGKWGNPKNWVNREDLPKPVPEPASEITGNASL